ncbi:MAG: S1C family serine protease, partial [Proteobacteria bacterium]|nr:S1C family serine protease [Pseudomonadota bacterium]
SADGTQNYIKSTAPLEHGNSGGASYNSSGQFIGIPTMVVAGTLNSMSYVLSVNSIKDWLSGILGSGYQEEVIEQEPIIEEPTVNIQEDITPLDVNEISLSYYAMDNGKNFKVLLNLPYAKADEAYTFASQIKFNWGQWKSDDLIGYYYYFGKNIFANPTEDGIFIPSVGKGEVYSPEIKLQEEDDYYFILKTKDTNQNISDKFIYKIHYSPYSKGQLNAITFFSDKSYSKVLKSYKIKFDKYFTDKGEAINWNPHPQQDAIVCQTKLDNLYFKWDYLDEINKEHVILSKNQIGDTSFYTEWWNGYLTDIKLELLEGEYINSNKSNIENMSNGEVIKQEYSKTLYPKNVYKQDESMINYEFYAKPYVDNLKIAADDRLFSVKYDPSSSENISCVFHYWEPTVRGGSGKYEIRELEEINQSTSQKQYDLNMVRKLLGKILLQVEQNGEAYYVYPDDSKRYYLGRPADAFNAMRKLGLGATHQFINNYTIYPDHVLGKILIDVEQNGEAYYIYPKDKKAYYLGRPADAFRIMRELGLGITNSDLSKIPEGSL